MTPTYISPRGGVKVKRPPNYGTDIIADRTSMIMVTCAIENELISTLFIIMQLVVNSFYLFFFFVLTLF